MDEDAPLPRRIAITGIAGYVGRELAAMFDVDETTDAILGIDVAPFTTSSDKTTFVQRSVEEPFDDLFSKHEIDGAIHLAFCLNPLRDRVREERINVQGTKNFLDACSKAKVRSVLVVSSATAYGAHPDNSGILYEGAPLRATPDFPYAHDKVRVEELCYEFARNNPEAILTIVRPCVIIGPHVNNFLSRMLDRRILMGVRGYDPPIQLIHEDDAVRAIFRLLKLRKIGVYNLAADGAITLGRMAQLANRTVLRLPAFLLRWLAKIAWSKGWTSVTEAPPGYLDYVIHPWCISNVKLKTELLFLFKYDALRAFNDFLDARAKRLGIEPPPPKEEDDELDLDDDEVEEEEEVKDTRPAPSAAAPAAAPAAGLDDKKQDAETEAPTPVNGTPLPPGGFGSQPDGTAPAPPASTPPA
jgi:UDP-glucose 4-epimerase